MLEVPLPGAAMEGGEKVMVIPAGAPAVEKTTGLLKPPDVAVVSVAVAWEFCAIEMLLVEVDRL